MLIYGYLKEFSKHTQLSNVIPDEIQDLIILFYQRSLNSAILSADEEHAFLELLENEKSNIMNQRSGFEWKLLFRSYCHVLASDEDKQYLSSKVYHKCCDDKEYTLHIIETDTNNVFGGFVCNELCKHESQWTEDANAFLFLIRSSKNYRMQLFGIKEKDRAYAYAKSSSCYGIFGLGHDICLWKWTGEATTGSYDIPNKENKYYLNGGREKFKWSKIEVFQMS